MSVVDVLADLPTDASAQLAGEVFGTPQYGGPPLRAAAARRVFSEPVACSACDPMTSV